jgi:carboxypeptidase Q
LIIPPLSIDIELLTKRGVPGCSPIQDNRTYFHYHHTAADTLDKIGPHDGMRIATTQRI